MSTDIKRIFSALIAGVASVVLLVVFPVPAQAAVKAKATRTQAVSAGSWSTVAVAQGSAATSDTTGALVIDWENYKSTPYAMIDLVNTSSLATTGQTFTLTTVPGPTGNQKIPTIQLDACVGASWNFATSVCPAPGKIVAMGSITGVAGRPSSLTSAVAIPSGTRLSVRATSSANLGNSYITTISITISRDQVRPATVTSS